MSGLLAAGRNVSFASAESIASRDAILRAARPCFQCGDGVEWFVTLTIGGRPVHSWCVMAHGLTVDDGRGQLVMRWVGPAYRPWHLRLRLWFARQVLGLSVTG